MVRNRGHRQGLRSDLTRYAVRSASALVVFTALAVPVLLGFRWWPSDVSAQHRTPPAALFTEDLADYTAFASNNEPSTAPVVISFHDVRPDTNGAGPYVVTPTQLEEMMSMLDAAGYSSITSEQMAAYLDGGSVPSRSVWITFDDGTKGVWQWADPILEQHGFTATAFVITGSVGEQQPYYLTWGELGRMRESGRWDIEAHTHEGHRLVDADAGGSDRGAFLLTRRWLPDAGRVETVEEWMERVRIDFQEGLQSLDDHGFDRPLFFAHPFAAVDSSVDSAIPRLLDELIEDMFVASVANDLNATTVGRRQIDNRHILRVAVRGNTSINELFDRLRTLDDGPST